MNEDTQKPHEFIPNRRCDRGSMRFAPRLAIARVIALLRLAGIVIGSIGFAFSSGIAQNGDLRAGAAATVITPPEKTPLAGYYSLRTADGVIDDLYSKALVFEQNETRTALVVCDLLTLPRPVVLRARQLIEERTGIPGRNVMIAATHAHTGPVIARESSRDALDGGSSDLGMQYTRELPTMIAESVEKAARGLTPARLLLAKTRVENLAFNRRFWMQDGTVGWNPPKLSPQIVAPAGPHDPEIGIVHLTTRDDKPRPLATLINYAMHPDTTGGTKISADFPGVLAERLGETQGKETLTIFANGACGNLNHRNVWWADRQQGRDETVRLGNILAGAVCAAWQQLLAANDVAVRVRSELLKLPLPTITEAEIAEARQIVRKRAGVQQKFLDQVKAFRVLDVQSREGQPWEVEVQVIAIGADLAIVSLPGEVFVELGLAIKAASPFKCTLIAELANGSIGYIPNRSAYSEGAYEVISARCAQGSGEMLVEAALWMLRELHR